MTNFLTRWWMGDFKKWGNASNGRMILKWGGYSFTDYDLQFFLKILKSPKTSNVLCQGKSGNTENLAKIEEKFSTNEIFDFHIYKSMVTLSNKGYKMSSVAIKFLEYHTKISYVGIIISLVIFCNINLFYNFIQFIVKLLNLI